MNTDGTGFNTCKECYKTESLWNHTTTDCNEEEQLEDRRNVGESICNFGYGTDQRVQSLMFMMMIMMMMMMTLTRSNFGIRNFPTHPALRFLWTDSPYRLLCSQVLDLRHQVLVAVIMRVQCVTGGVLDGSVIWWTNKLLIKLLHICDITSSHSDVLHCHQHSTQMVPFDS